MFQRFIDYFVKYANSFKLLFIALFVGIMAVGGGGFADEAHSPFWWTLWAVLGAVCFVGWFVAWAVAWNKQRRRDNA